MSRSPRARRMPPPKHSQRGAAFMIMLVIMIIGAITIFVSALNSSALYTSRDKTTADALVQAKEALVGYSLATAANPGGLPCPDLLTNIPSNVPNDGIADIPVGGVCPSYIGRLPWKTLGLPDLRDGSGERLWYALSSNFRDDPSNPINSNSLGTLQVYDNSGVSTLVPAYDGAAIIFAPGSIVGTQQRDTANQNMAQNYLDAGPNSVNNYNASGPFVSATPSSTFDDRLLVIRTSDIIPLVEARVAKELVNSFAAYLVLNGTIYYPYPANFSCTSAANCTSDATQCIGKIPTGSMTTLPAWFSPNRWFDVIYYSAGANRLPGGAGGGGGGAGKRGKGKKGGGVGSGGGGTPGCTPFMSVLDSSGALITSTASAVFLLPDTPIGGYAGTTRSSMSTTNLPAYFEDTENQNLDNLYIMPTAISNDSLDILP